MGAEAAFCKCSRQQKPTLQNNPQDAREALCFIRET